MSPLRYARDTSLMHCVDTWIWLLNAVKQPGLSCLLAEVMLGTAAEFVAGSELVFKRLSRLRKLSYFAGKPEKC